MDKNERKLIGCLVGMFLMSHAAGTVNGGFHNEANKPFSLQGDSTGYSVRSEGEDGEVAIRVTLVESGAPFVAELDTEGVVMVMEGSAEGFIQACKRYIG